MPTLTTSSTSSPVQPRYWGKLHSLHLSLAAWQFPSLGKILLAHYTKYVFSSLWHTFQISQYLPHCAGKPIPGPHNQLLGAQKKLFQKIKALTFINNSCKTWRANPAPTETWNAVKTSILSSIIRCYVKATETIIATNKKKHLINQPLMELIKYQTAVINPKSEFLLFARKSSEQSPL